MRRRLDNVDWADPFSYVRVMYGVPARLGGSVRFRGAPAEITGVDGQYLRIMLGGARESVLVHPTWRMEYGESS